MAWTCCNFHLPNTCILHAFNKCDHEYNFFFIFSVWPSIYQGVSGQRVELLCTDWYRGWHWPSVPAIPTPQGEPRSHPQRVELWWGNHHITQSQHQVCYDLSYLLSMFVWLGGGGIILPLGTLSSYVWREGGNNWQSLCVL